MTDEIMPASNEVVTPSEVVTPDFDVSKYFSEDLKSDPDFERLSKNIPNDPIALVKDLYHKTKHFGKVKESVRAELEAESVKSFKAEDYKYDLPENYKIEDELLSSANNKAAELGINPDQLKGLMEAIFQTDLQTKIKEEQLQQQANDEALSSLKKEWGVDYDKKANKAETMLQYFTSTEDDKKIQNLPAEAKILLAKLMDKVGQKIAEPSIGKIASPSAGKMSESEFHSKISEIRANKMLTSNQMENQIADLYGSFYSKEDVKKEFGLTN